MMIKKTNTEKNFNICLIITAVVTAVAYFLLCHGDLVWMDEAYTFGMIKRSYRDICSITALDVHPPLYYIMLKAFSLPFSNKLMAGKIFSTIPYLIIQVYGAIELKKIFNAKTGTAFSILFLMLPFFQKYVTEVRMYSWSGLFVFVNALYAYKAYISDKRGAWAILIISGLCAAYMHYFALASVIIIYGLMLLAIAVKKRELLKKWGISVGVSVVLYIPWLRFFIIQLKYKIDNEYWIDPITLKTFKSYLCEIFGANGELLPAIVLLAVFVGIITVTFIKKSRVRAITVMAAAVPLLTLAAGVLASYVIRPVFVVRYLLPSMPLFTASVSIAMGELTDKRVQSILMAVVIAFGLINYSDVYYDKNTHFDGRMDDAFYERNSDCDAYIVYIDRDDITPGQTETVLAYYETEKEIYQVIENYGYYPFENFRYINDFEAEKYDRVIMLVAGGKEIPDEYKAEYDYQYRETTTSLWIPADVYLLTKK